jgi:hypothetical protein
MSSGEETLPRALPRLRQFAVIHAAVRTPRSLVYFGCAVLALVCNYALGVDRGWDTLNYHLYAGLSAVTDRFSQDYFAAGPQSYFNPYAYAPFYALVRSGLPALAASSVLAVAHSAVLWLTYELALCAFPKSETRERVLAGVCAVVLAFLNPILIEQIGSSFADISTAALVLCGWCLLARAVHTPRATVVACAGLILGVGSALKLTNAVHAVAALAVLLMVPLPLRGKLRYALQYTGAAALGLAIVAAPWAYRLEQQFGNPVFPLLNGMFHSPEFTSEPLRSYRFVPGGVFEALWRPFAIINPVPMVQEEASAPDLRYAVVLVLLAVALVRWSRRTPVGAQRPLDADPREDTRVLIALGLGLAVDWALWLAASGNGRYFLPMASVVAVIIVALLFRMFATQPRIRNYALGALFGCQIIQLWLGAEYRWDPLPWGAPWFKVDMPASLATEPTLQLTVGVQSNSFLAAYFASGSGLVNFSGGYALGQRGANGARVTALIRRYAPRVRVLVPGLSLDQDAGERTRNRSQVDDVLERFDLRVDPGDCAIITVHGVPPPIAIQTVGNTHSIERQPRDRTTLVSCLAVPEDPAALHSGVRARQRAAADLVLDRLEDACPKLFQPRRLLTEHIGSHWQRFYMNTDLIAWVSRGEVRFQDLLRNDGLGYLGRESDWTEGSSRLACGRRDGHYFARVIGSEEMR